MDHLLSDDGEEVLRIVFVVVTVGCAITSGLFVLSYGFFFHWRQTLPGRVIMYLVMSMFATFTIVALYRVFGADYPGRTLISAVVYCTVLITLVRLLFVLWRHWVEPPNPNQLDDIDVEARRDDENDSSSSLTP